MIKINKWRAIRHLKSSITKDTSIPDIYVTSNMNANGTYQWYTNKKYYKKNIIIIRANNTGNIFSSILTHELCHHRQHMSGRLKKNIYQPSDWTKNYWDKIIKYFMLNINEYEALLTEYKYYKTETSKEWISKLKEYAASNGRTLK